MNELQLRKLAVEKMKRYYENAAKLVIQNIKDNIFTKVKNE